MLHVPFRRAKARLAEAGLVEVKSVVSRPGNRHLMFCRNAHVYHKPECSRRLLDLGILCGSISLFSTVVRRKMPRQGPER